MKLALDLKPGEAVRVGAALVLLEKKSGQSARLVVRAPRFLPVQRVAGAEKKSFAPPLDTAAPRMA